MKTNFSATFYRMPGGVGAGALSQIGGGLGSASSTAAGATPFGAIAQTGVGLLQSIFGGIKAHKAQKQLEKLQTPTYTKNQGILDYYNNALQRYNTAPTESSLYKRQANNVQRNIASGLSVLNSRRGALAGVNKLIQGGNDAMLNAEVQAENQRNQRFNELAGATNMKTSDDLRDFQYNKIAPYEKKYNLLAMKAGANNQVTNAGLNNLYGGLSSMQDYQTLKKLYGN